VLEVSLSDQFFCEACGAPLVEEEQQRVLPDWLPDVPLEGGSTEADTWLASGPESDRQAGPTDRQPKGMASGKRPTDQQRKSASWVLVLGIAMFLASLCVLCWVLLAIAWTRAPDPASLLMVSRVVTVSADQPWQDSGVRVRKGQVVSIRYLDGAWGIWGGPRAVEQFVGAAGLPGEYRSLGLPLGSAPAGALIGRIGKGDPFYVGTHTRFRSAERGRLELTINDHWVGDNLGAVRVQIQVLTGQ